MTFGKVFSLVVLVVFLLGFLILRIAQWKPGKASILVNTHELHVLVAQTPTQLYRGLGNRDSLGEYHGMVLMFPKTTRQGIVMRDMRFPLDIVWINKGEVVDIAHNIPTEQKPTSGWTPYYPREEANAVLELPAGDAMRYDLKIGDIVEVVE